MNKSFFIIVAIILATVASVVSAQSTSAPPPAPTPTPPPRNWYQATVKGSANTFTKVDFQMGFATQFASSGLGVWLMTFYPDPPVYDSSRNVYEFKFTMSSSNATQRDAVFKQYLTSTPALTGLKASLYNGQNSIDLSAIVTTTAPADFTPSPPVARQWFAVTLKGRTYSDPLFQQCMSNALPALVGSTIETFPATTNYIDATDTRVFKFAYVDDNSVKHQNTLMGYLSVSPSYTQLYDACYTPHIRINIQSLATTTTPDPYTTPAPPNNGGNSGSDDSQLIPGLTNWISYTLIGVAVFVVVGVSFFVAMSYCRAQDDDGNAAGSTKNVKFDNRKNQRAAGEAALAYQNADVQDKEQA